MMKTKFASIALIIILGFAVYGNSLNGKFIWDDGTLVKDNVYIKSWSHILKIFEKDIGAGAGEKYNFYRPLQMLTYMLDYSLWKLNVKGYHLTNTFLHILAALSIFWLINLLYHDKLLSLLTSIFFVVHPIHTEAVAYISGRADPLALLFMLLCFIFYIKSLHSKSATIYIMTLLSYILALLSRESSLILPMLLLLYHYSFKERLRPKRFLPVLGIAFLHILLRLTALISLFPDVSSSATLLQRIPGFFVAITNYIRLMFLPFNLHVEHGKKLFQLTNPRAILGILMLSSLLIYTFRKRNANSLIFFSISWFFIALLPLSNIYPINAYMAEHWLYLPSIGFFLILAKFLCSIYRSKSFKMLTGVLIISLVTFYSCLTIRQNNYWKEPIAFYERTLKYVPDNSGMHSNLGAAYYAAGEKDKAIASYRKAIEINPSCTQAYNNLGVIYRRIGKKEEAITLYEKVIEINPNRANAYNNLANAYSDIGKKDQALASYKKAITINPQFAKAYNGLGVVYDAINKKEEAIASYKKAIEINPQFAKAYNNLGTAYYATDKKDQALASYKKAIEIDPEIAEAYNGLGAVYEAINKKDEALVLYKKAIEIDPGYTKAYYNLSVLYLRRKEYKLAIEYFDKAVGLGLTNPVLSEALKPYRDRR